ncbi:hypothetical protein [Rhizorhapis suberifaciens]|uniref:Trm5-related predicted tRNA methylase n=1 Tax=Rhizorhapis suberifaciens TaxID=13656 RepID=A0A840HVK7_9SPHN|nr:hypothetical protein [Rhizorhapis suberifaciens]MBB4642322.1 Trm5-related predicted tRNA methylase [Rhizorhapis suberifaciens]
MTAAARISQADMERAVKAVKAGGYERARIVMDLEKQRIEVIIGESEEVAPPAADDWRRNQPLYSGQG